VVVTIVDGVRVVSNSELQAFKWCRRHWWLAWYRGLTPRAGESVTGAAATGTRIHEALAGYYVPDDQPAADPLVTLRAAQQRDLALHVGRAFGPDQPLGDENERALTLSEGKRLESDFVLEQRVIEGYLEWLAETGADAEWEIIGSEQYVETVIEVEDCGPVKLIGKLDARVRSRVTGQLRFIDHKTVSTLFDPLLGLNQQMLHYELIGTLLGWGPTTGALYNMLRKVKRTAAARPPFYARVQIDHNKHELQAYSAQLAGTIRDMIDVERRLAAGVSHHAAAYPTPGRDCGWRCQFVGVCRLLNDGSRSEDALTDLYEVRDPLTYYGSSREGE
jgi:hypothetical protein